MRYYIVNCPEHRVGAQYRQSLSPTCKQGFEKAMKMKSVRGSGTARNLP